MDLASPLHQVYRATHSPAAFRELGGLVVWWRLTIHGTNGEAIGVREVTHRADCAFAERDRIEYEDGRVYARVGAQVYAVRNGFPWETLVDGARDELMLFGVQLRMPWCFGDGGTFVVTTHDVQERSGERFTHLVVERRPPASLEVFGPESDPKPRDRFELLCTPSTGQPRELVHRFASSQQTRRVLLEDWREVGGIRIPHRRVYVNDALRPATTLEILRIERERLSERDFRLH